MRARSVCPGCVPPLCPWPIQSHIVNFVIPARASIRREPNLSSPTRLTQEDTKEFAFLPWFTGLGITLILPLLIVLMAHGLVSIPLFETQGTLIFSLLRLGYIRSSDIQSLSA